jgi:flagellar biosynthetic protein FlhB
MATDDGGEDKTEDPTDRRRSQAREQGNIAKSSDVTAAAVLLAATIGLYALAPLIGESLLGLMRGALATPPPATVDRISASLKLQQIGLAIGMVLVPMLLLVMGGSLGANLAQVGFLWSPEVIQPNFGRINPLSGFGRLFSLQSTMRLVGSLIKITVVASVATLFLQSHREELLGLGELELSQLLAIAGRLLCELGLYLSLALISIAVLDYGYQWWQHEQDLRMTKQELREELKEMDGNPQMRAKRKEAHRKLADARDLGAVSTADVVITNPTHIAVAIKYDPDTMPAPTVVAKGMGEIAAQIRLLAARHGIPIIERKPLARTLYKQVKVGRTIPPDLYEAFVEILAYVYRLTGKRPPSL